ERCRVRFGRHLRRGRLFGLPEYEAPRGSDLLDEPAEQRPPALEARRGLLHELDRLALEVLLRGDEVDEPHPLRALRVELLAREDEVEGGGEADEARQALRAAETGDDAELRFREPDLRGLRVGGDAHRAGEHELRASPEARSADRRGGGNGEVRDLLEDDLP